MKVPSQVEEHVATIAKHEKDFVESLTSAERVADRVACFAGQMTFVLMHIGVFAMWLLWNSVPITHRWHVDPYPYAFFDTIVALEAILLASFILMRQSSLARRAYEREHLMLQILLLTEKEVSAVIRTSQRIADHFDITEISKDRELKELAAPTPIDEVAQTIQEKLAAE